MAAFSYKRHTSTSHQIARERFLRAVTVKLRDAFQRGLDANFGFCRVWQTQESTGWKEGFITLAKRHSVSWHLETSLRTINQKNLLNIASSNGEGVFSWLSMLSTVSGEVRGVCVHVVLENTLGWVFYNEHPSFPSGIKRNWWSGNFLKTTFKVWFPQIRPFLCFSRVTSSPAVFSGLSYMRYEAFMRRNKRSS